MEFHSRPLPSERAAAIYERLTKRGILDRLNLVPDDPDAATARHLIRRLERAADPLSNVTVTIGELDTLGSLIAKVLRHRGLA